MSPRFKLKAATDDLHSELDGRLSRLDLGQVADYRRFLRLHAQAVPPIEAALAAGGLGQLVDGWSGSRRSSAIESDLAAIGDEMPDPGLTPRVASTAELLGTAYVLEGSRLGAKLMKHRIGSEFPASFLSGDKSADPWPALVAAVDRLLYSDALIGEAKHAARRGFALFLDAAREAGI